MFIDFVPSSCPSHDPNHSPYHGRRYHVALHSNYTPVRVLHGHEIVAGILDRWLFGGRHVLRSFGSNVNLAPHLDRSFHVHFNNEVLSRHFLARQTHENGGKAACILVHGKIILKSWKQSRSNLRNQGINVLRSEKPWLRRVGTVRTFCGE